MLINDTAVTDYSHMITTRPNDIRRVVISDLHLSADEPALVQAFLALINDLIALPHLKELYILGDWFDAWVGDDNYLTLSNIEMRRHWLTPVIHQLSQLTLSGCQIKVMHGNRDFLIGQDFCDLFKGKLIPEPYLLTLGDQTIRMEHGDALCTDDKSYQRFRIIIRNPITQYLLLKRPLQKRLDLAQKIRTKSALDKSSKSMSIMDVNQAAVIKALKPVNCLLHGHTHRPAKHQVVIDAKHHLTKSRYVLGDWRLISPDTSYEQVEAVIAVTTAEINSLDQPILDQENLDQNQSAEKESLQLVKFVVKT